jgi:hypothetical protein
VVDSNSDFKWVYGLKTKDEVDQTMKKWYSDIAKEREKYPLLGVMRDNAGENKSKSLTEFFENHGVKNYYSTPYEQWQDGQPETAIRTLSRLARSEIHQSGLYGKSWFSAMCDAKEATNSTYNAALGTTPWFSMYGEKRDLTKFRPFGCKAYAYNEPIRRDGPGKFVDRAIEGINLGFANDSGMSAYKIFIPSQGTIRITNQVRFDETSYPMRKISRADSWHVEEDDAEFQVISDEPKVQRHMVPYNSELYQRGLRIVSRDPDANTITLKILDDEDSYTTVHVDQWYRELAAKAMDVSEPHPTALKAGPIRQPLAGLPASIDYLNPPKSYSQAMQRIDSAEWEEAYSNEFEGFKSRGAMVFATPKPGSKILGTTTRTEYKTDNGTFIKRKVRMCVRGDQQTEGLDYHQEDLYAPVVKAAEVRLLTAIAAQHKCTVYKTDCKQAFLYGELEEGVDIYIRPPDWWPEPTPPGQALQLMSAIYGTKQAARAWHSKISTWMVSTGYKAVNDEKTIFMRREGDEFLIHGLFVDDMKHITNGLRLYKEFLDKYAAAFDITGGHAMDSFLGMAMEQGDGFINIHLDDYTRLMLEEYSAFVNKPLRSKHLPMSPNHYLTGDDLPQVPDARQSFYRSFVQKLQYLAQWNRFDIQYTVSQLARFGARAGPHHWAAMHHLMEYLSTTPSVKLTYKAGGLDVDGLTAYVDSDWGNHPSRKSTSGYLVLYNGYSHCLEIQTATDDCFVDG